MDSHQTPDFALAIRPLQTQQIAPVVYDLNGASIEIGSAENNHIVLDGDGVAPFHLAIRQVGERLYVLVDQLVAARSGETIWLEPRQGDRFFCPQHGEVAQGQPDGLCPLCGDSRALWLLRPLRAGDVFPIGVSFEASILSQGRARTAAPQDEPITPSPWPDSDWLQHPPQPEPAVVLAQDDHVFAERAYPLDNSNLWLWSPPESPLPVFMHQRVTRFVTRHACDNLNREIGGVLLGQVYHDPRDGVEYPVITHAIAARFATEARGHLTFTRETWLDINTQRDERYPDKRIVGWYHTHPGLDIFLSHWDLFIHRNFFTEPWQVALVIDPQQQAAGFFVWSDDDILDPQRPHRLFRIAEPDEGADSERRARVRIKLGEVVG